MDEIPSRPSEPPAASTPQMMDRPRRPYDAPRLRRLGSVRDLTFGSNVGFVEGAGTFKMR